MSQYSNEPVKAIFLPTSRAWLIVTAVVMAPALFLHRVQDQLLLSFPGYLAYLAVVMHILFKRNSIECSKGRFIMVWVLFLVSTASLAVVLFLLPFALTPLIGTSKTALIATIAIVLTVVLAFAMQTVPRLNFDQATRYSAICWGSFLLSYLLISFIFDGLEFLTDLG